jgi:hypothetical protein
MGATRPQPRNFLTFPALSRHGRRLIVSTMITGHAVHARVCIALLVAASAACSSARTPTPSPAVAPAQTAALDSLAGRWDFSVDLGARQTPGELWLFRRGAELTGTLAPAGTNTLPVRALTMRADSAHLTVDTPEGPVTFAGVVTDSRSAMRGIVTYHHGQRFPMTATKRVQP